MLIKTKGVNWCANCPARASNSTYSTKVVSSDGPGDAALLLVGEAPGAEEDDAGVPFVGRSGQFLRKHIDAFEYPSVRYTNVVRCRPEDNKTPSPKVVSVCARKLMAEIRKVKPRAVLLLGNVPLKAVLGESGITTWRGTPHQRDGILYMPTYHPSYVMRQMNAGDSVTYDAWVNDLVYVNNYISGAEHPKATPSQKFVVVDTEHKLHQMVAVLLASKCMSFDTEVGNFDTDRRLLCVSFACDAGAWVIPLSHADSVWSARLNVPLDAIKRVLTDCEAVGHNLKFDMRQMLQLTGLAVEKPVGDTMLLSALADPRKGVHGLKQLATRYLWMDYDRQLVSWKNHHDDSNPSRGGSYGAIPGSILFEYAAKDAIATWHLWKLLRASDAITPMMLTLHDQLLVSATKALTSVEVAGIALDMHIVHRYNALYNHAAQGVYIQLVRGNAALRRMIRDRRSSGKAADVAWLPNLRSSEQVATWLYEYEGLQCMQRTDTGKPSVSADALAPHSDHEAVQKLQLVRMYEGVRAKCLEPAAHKWLAPDGCVHSTFNINGAVTGRLSSSEPNMQNIPAPEKEPGTLLAYLPVKNMFTSRWRDIGGMLLQIDYSAMELRVFASLANCRSMLRAFADGVDIHTLVTSKLHGIAEDAVTKEQRYRGKWVSWTTLFGGDEHTLHRLYGVPLPEAVRLLKEYKENFPEIVEFQLQTLRDARRDGYVETPFGRRYVTTWLDDKRELAKAADEARTLLNFPVQSTATDTVLAALCIIHEHMQQRKMRSLIVNTVHDNIVTDIYPGELEAVVCLQTNIMLNVHKHAKRHMPGLHFGWLRAALAVDVECGTHYGALQPLDWEAL